MADKVDKAKEALKKAEEQKAREVKDAEKRKDYQDGHIYHVESSRQGERNLWGLFGYLFDRGADKLGSAISGIETEPVKLEDYIEEPIAPPASEGARGVAGNLRIFHALAAAAVAGSLIFFRTEIANFLGRGIDKAEAAAEKQKQYNLDLYNNGWKVTLPDGREYSLDRETGQLWIPREVSKDGVVTKVERKEQFADYEAAAQVVYELIKQNKDSKSFRDNIEESIVERGFSLSYVDRYKIALYKIPNDKYVPESEYVEGVGSRPSHVDRTYIITATPPRKGQEPDTVITLEKPIKRPQAVLNKGAFLSTLYGFDVGTTSAINKLIGSNITLGLAPQHHLTEDGVYSSPEYRKAVEIYYETADKSIPAELLDKLNKPVGSNSLARENLEDFNPNPNYERGSDGSDIYTRGYSTDSTIADPKAREGRFIPRGQKKYSETLNVHRDNFIEGGGQIGEKFFLDLFESASGSVKAHTVAEMCEFKGGRLALPEMRNQLGIKADTLRTIVAYCLKDRSKFIKQFVGVEKTADYAADLDDIVKGYFTPKEQNGFVGGKPTMTQLNSLYDRVVEGMIYQKGKNKISSILTGKADPKYTGFIKKVDVGSIKWDEKYQRLVAKPDLKQESSVPAKVEKNVIVNV